MSEYLALTSELAAAFAGFTALVTVLDRKQDAVNRDLNALRLRQMLELSLLSIAGGLMPHLFGELGASGATQWRLAAAVLAAATLVLVHVNAAKGFHDTIQRIPEFSLAYARFLLAMGLATLLAFVLAGAELVPPRAGYILGVTLLLTLAGLQFLRTTSRTVLRLPMDAHRGAVRESPSRGEGSATLSSNDASSSPPITLVR